MTGAPALAVDNGPTETQWNAMISNRDKYIPLIEKFVGYCIMRGALHGDEDIPPIESAVSRIPELADISDDELYFVGIGAVNVLCHGRPDQEIRKMARHWLDDGAPE
ncbi:hypothetical protein ABIA22_000391 [Sinorhizobium fredii]|uniref:hypothetical protein n=1 Tax=Rhizobium fredii TaxID=380 RepID=UPI003511BDDA